MVSTLAQVTAYLGFEAMLLCNKIVRIIYADVSSVSVCKFKLEYIFVISDARRFLHNKQLALISILG